MLHGSNESWNCTNNGDHKRAKNATAQLNRKSASTECDNLITTGSAFISFDFNSHFLCYFIFYQCSWYLKISHSACHLSRMLSHQFHYSIKLSTFLCAFQSVSIKPPPHACPNVTFPITPQLLPRPFSFIFPVPYAWALIPSNRPSTYICCWFDLMQFARIFIEWPMVFAHTYGAWSHVFIRNELLINTCVFLPVFSFVFHACFNVSLIVL